MGKLWEILKTVVTLTDDLQKYHAEMKEIRKELRDLSIAVSLLAQDNRHTKEQSESNREKLLLELENRLLKMERRLPPAEEEKPADKQMGRKGSKK
jgi:uncharacterized protein YoxC